MKIDTHGHIYPEVYLSELEKISDVIQLVPVPDGRRGMKDRKGTTLGATKRIKIEDRIADLERMKVDVQILSIANPGVHFADKQTNLSLAQSVNDYMADICQKYPQKFLCFATVPLNDVEGSIGEIKRAINKLKMNGLCLGTNINGKPLDSPEFAPFFQVANEMGLPVSLHPMTPVAIEVLREYALVPVIGFGLDTTITATRMIFSGMLEKYPNINFILSHLGGALPYMAGRLEFGYNEFTDCKKNISRPPSYYLKRFYYDTALSFHKPTLKCAYETVGVSQIVLGSDYPHSASTPIPVIEEIGWSAKDKEDIYNQNIQRILKNCPW
jgi:aminocarboxymuconate-semialdehyde decarboxylase